MRKKVLAATEPGVRTQALIVALAAFLTYSNSLSGPFILDDQSAIVQNAEIRDISRLDRVFSPAPNSSESGRPLVNLSFAINYAVGGLDVRGYHVLNLALHVACALLMFGIIRRTLELPGVRERYGAIATGVAFAAALLWVVHPLNSEVVDYLTQRTESLMALFLVLTLYAAIRAFTSSLSKWRAIAIVSCVLGMGCKESMVTAPVLVALYDRVYLFGSWREALRSRGRLYLGLTSAWIVLAAFVVSGPRAAVSGFSSGVSIWTYLLNQTVMITEYLQLTIWPSSLVVFYGWPLPLELSDVLPYAAFIVALLAICAVALARVPRLGFLGAWFFITLAPTSSVIAIATEVGAERRMYLPLMALAVLTVLAGQALLAAATPSAVAHEKPRSNRDPNTAAGVVRIVAVTILVSALAVTTWARNRDYASGLTLARTVVERRPSSIAFHILGEQLLVAGRDDEAVGYLRQAVAGGNSRAGYQLGGTLFNQGKPDEALQRLEAFVQTEGKPLVPRWLVPPITDVLSARVAMAEILGSKQQWPEAEAQARMVLAKAPSHVGAQRILAGAVFAQQRWPEAVREYEDYLRRNPRDAQGLSNFGVALVATGKINDAVEVFRRAVELDPQSSNARRLLELAIKDRDASTASQP